MSKEAMTLALEALEGSIAITMAKIDLRNTAIKALEEALASEQEQGEPFGWYDMEHGEIRDVEWNRLKPTYEGVWRPLYTTPQPAQKPLTDEQREEIARGWRGRNWTVGDIIDVIEAAHGIKENT